MGDKVKGVLSIFFMAVTFFMMVTTKYTHALGDYILEFIGLKSWTGDYSGTHLTVIYFGVLFIISLFVVGKYTLLVGFDFVSINIITTIKGVFYGPRIQTYCTIRTQGRQSCFDWSAHTN